MPELKVAIIGGGSMGEAHSLALAIAPYSAGCGVTIVKQVLVEISPERADELARQFGWQESSSDWRAVVNRGDIDVIDICTPPHLHEEIALAAIAAGKHVFCEKPITNDSAQALRMRDAAEAAGVVAQVGYNFRHTPALAFTKKLLDEGRLGVPLMFRGSYCQEVGFGRSLDSWRATKALGAAGTVGEVGCHVIDAAEFFCGDILRVAARVRTRVSDDDSGWASEAERIEQDLVDWAGVWTAEFASGALGSFAVSSYASGCKNRFAFELDASKGAVHFDWNNREVFQIAYVDDPSDQSGLRSVSTNSQDHGGIWGLAGMGIGYVDVSAAQFQRFVQAITAGTPTEPDFRAGAHNQQVVEAIQQAASLNTWVEVPRSRD